MKRLLAVLYDLVFLVAWFVPVSVVAFTSMLNDVPSSSWLLPVFRAFIPHEPWSNPSKARLVGAVVMSFFVYAVSYQVALHALAGGTFGERVAGLDEVLPNRRTRTAWLLFGHFLLSVFVFRIGMMFWTV